MSLGGNLRLKKHYSDYDLLEENPEKRYQTNAADFYRRNLRALVEGDAMMEEPPQKEEG